MNAVARMMELIGKNRSGKQAGIYSVCSAHPLVLEAACRQAATDGSILLVEGTVNQVNHEGGYTGKTPKRFRDDLCAIATTAGLSTDDIVLGADHVGPFPVSKTHRPKEAMAWAGVAMRAFVQAGAAKLHLDPSEPCKGDPVPLPPEVIAERSAELCAVAEAEWDSLGLPGSPIYVCGTEVPPPGGARPDDKIQVTDPEQMHETLDLMRRAFERRDLEGAFARVVAIVVQPGVEFGTAGIHDFDEASARELTAAIHRHGRIVGEAHSTDYQRKSALHAMVRSGFPILKVGPWLTFALREGLGGLESCEQELIAAGLIPESDASRLRSTVDVAMLSNPKYWRAYYDGTEKEQRFKRWFHALDRVRYYWPEASVQAAQEQLFANLRGLKGGIPLELLDQYLPGQVGAVREGEIDPDPRELIIHRIRRILQHYAEACGLSRC